MYFTQMILLTAGLITVQFMSAVISHDTNSREFLAIEEAFIIPAALWLPWYYVPIMLATSQVVVQGLKGIAPHKTAFNVINHSITGSIAAFMAFSLTGAIFGTVLFNVLTAATVSYMVARERGVSWWSCASAEPALRGIMLISALSLGGAMTVGPHLTSGIGFLAVAFQFLMQSREAEQVVPARVYV